MAFSAFPPETIGFLEGISANNTKAWFEAHRGDYESFFVAPAKDFVIAAGAGLAELAPAVSAEPRVNGSIFRINRDIRFSKDKTPYKDHLDFWFWEGPRKGAVSGFFLRVAPAGVIIGAGAHGFDKERLAAYRAALGQAGPARALAGIVGAIETAGFEVGGARYKRPPKEVAVAAGAEALALHDALYVHATEPVATATAPGALTAACRKHWGVFAPLHGWLVDHVQGR